MRVQRFFKKIKRIENDMMCEGVGGVRFSLFLWQTGHMSKGEYS